MTDTSRRNEGLINLINVFYIDQLVLDNYRWMKAAYICASSYKLSVTDNRKCVKNLMTDC